MTERQFSLSPEELQSFDQNGFIGPFPLYSREEMQNQLRSLRGKLLNLDRSIYDAGATASGTTNLSTYDRHLDIEFLMQHIKRPEIVDRVASILGEDLLCWRTEFFHKYPGDEGTDWHQASNFAGVAGDKKPQIEWPDGSRFGGTITVWTAFTDATIEKGCMQFVPGTHKTMFYDESKVITYDADRINNSEKEGVRRGFFGYDYRELQKDPNWRPDEEAAVSMQVPAGHFFIFWSTLLHASHPHLGLTKDMRLAYAARYLPTKVKVYPHSRQLQEFGGTASLEQHRCVLVSGEDSYGHNVFDVEDKVCA